MKKIVVLLVLISVLFTSCTMIEFKEISPKKGKEVKVFPEEMRGTYYDIKEKEILTVGKNSFKYGSKNSTLKLSGDISDIKTVLKKMEGYYFLNTKEKGDENWAVIPFKYEKDRIEVYYLSLDKDELSKEEQLKYQAERLKLLRSITDIKLISSPEDMGKNYLINPSDQQLKTILDKGLFEKVIEFRRVKNN